MINFLIQRFIERFDMVVAVNFTIPVVWDLFEKAVQTGKIRYIGFAFVAPIVGMVLGKFLRAMLKPKPFTVETLGFRFEVPQLPQVTAKAPPETEHDLEDLLDFEYSFETVALGSFWLGEELDYEEIVMSPTSYETTEYLDFKYEILMPVLGSFYVEEELDYAWTLTTEETTRITEEADIEEALDFENYFTTHAEGSYYAEEKLGYEYSVVSELFTSEDERFYSPVTEPTVNILVSEE